MARTILMVLVMVLLNVLAGCHSVDSGASQLLAPQSKAAPGPARLADKAGEADIVEQMAINRQAYRQYLESLMGYYKSVGNNMKLTWAKKELKKLDKMPQYNYIIGAIVAGPNLKASDSIAMANYMYQDAVRLEKKAGRLIVIKHEDRLRMALEQYNQVIRKHPTSDKIDDAAFRAAGIYEHFKDYTIALLYYQRTYQWDPETIYPARFKAAYILDMHLHRRAEAMQLYQQVLRKGGLSKERKEFIEERIAEFTKTDRAEADKERK